MIVRGEVRLWGLLCVQVLDRVGSRAREGLVLSSSSYCVLRQAFERLCKMLFCVRGFVLGGRRRLSMNLIVAPPL